MKTAPCGKAHAEAELSVQGRSNLMTTDCDDGEKLKVAKVVDSGTKRKGKASEKQNRQIARETPHLLSESE
jgi:D-serine deaminase-like pyridoxal phosphate-dependent protein